MDIPLRVRLAVATAVAVSVWSAAIGLTLALHPERARSLLLGLEGISVLLSLAAFALVRRNIVRPIIRLTEHMKKLVVNDTNFAVAGTERGDEVGLISHTVEAFRDSIIRSRQAGLELQLRNMQLDATLDSMMQGVLVWSPRQTVELVNRRYYEILNIVPDSLKVGMTIGDVVRNYHRNQLHLDKTVAEMSGFIRKLITGGESVELVSNFHANLTIRVLVEPMRNGGAVITYEDITERLQSQERVKFLALHDALTGLSNRKKFQDYLDGLSGAAERQDGYAVLCLDLDHFKEVNDTLGHIAGDELLRAVAERLRGCLRSEDLAARLGGDEFAVVLEGLENAETQAAEIANRLVTAIAAPYEVLGTTVVIGVSVGIALAEADASGPDLLRRADVALYKAKEERGTYALYVAGMGDALIARRALEADLRLALHRGEFVLHYQPLFNVIEERITGFEALIRWDSPTRGWVPPMDFIPLAEQTGLILPIGEWVLRSACADAARWPDGLRVAVNLSAVQVKSRNVVDLVSDILADTELLPSRLELEITETAMLQDTDMVVGTLNGLHDMGVRIAMDDFGTGFSSLNYLRLFPFDKIKIDRTFINDLDDPVDGRPRMPSGPGSAETIIRAIVGLGNNLGISTTAEGVETAQQFNRVSDDGCTEVQGSFISPPLPVAQVAALLQDMKVQTGLKGESVAA